MPTKYRKRSCHLADFFKDSRGSFDIFTVVNLLAGLGLVYALVKQVNRTGTVQTELLYAIFFMYLVSNVGEKLLAAVIERGVWKMPPAPDTQITADVKTDAVNVGAGEVEGEKPLGASGE